MTLDPARLGAILRASRSIAVVGLSPRTERPSHRVAEYLQGAGFRIVPVRPGARRILGEPAWPDLRTAAQHAGPPDIVNVFRRSETIPDLLEALLALRPRLVWLQVGVRHEPAAARLEAADIPIVMDRCLMVDHSWLVNP